MVYIREAHPADQDWPENIFDDIIFDDPDDEEGREEICELFYIHEELSIPAVIDGIDDKVRNAYIAYLNRLMIVDTDGTTYFGGPIGPEVGENLLEAALEELFPDA